MKKSIINPLLYIGGIGIFILIWSAISFFIGNPISIFPNPFNTVTEAISILGTSYFYKCFGMSLLRMFIGFAVALLVALLFGILAGTIKWVEKLLKPTITILKAIPTAALILLFLVLLGAKNTPILIVVLICFPILYESVVGGFNNINQEIQDTLRVDSGKIVSDVFKVKIPLSMPHILVGISSSFALSFKIEIMAEIISGDTGYGLGTAISYAQSHNPSNMVPVFAYSFLAIVFMLIITLLMNLVKKKFVNK